MNLHHHVSFVSEAMWQNWWGQEKGTNWHSLCVAGDIRGSWRAPVSEPRPVSRGLGGRNRESDEGDSSKNWDYKNTLLKLFKNTNKWNSGLEARCTQPELMNKIKSVSLRGGIRWPIRPKWDLLRFAMVGHKS